ncbi:MAG: hypothetical protein J3Q66DRAFT_136924 [Benniella sp.]|nr:MAG: hypothetical protein J3Q66DRAFT_136924 [Benniella sp.]
MINTKASKFSPLTHTCTSQHTMNLVYAFLLFFSVAAILVHGQLNERLSSKAIFTGVDNTDPDASRVKIFRNPRNHASAIASIIANRAQSNFFLPKTLAREKLPDHFYKFASSLPTRTILKSTRKRDFFLDLTGDLNQFKEVITANYVPLSGKADDAASAFVEQIPQSLDTQSDESWALVLITIHGGDNDQIAFDISWINVLLSFDNGSVIIPEQTAYMSQGSYKVETDQLVRNADLLADLFSTIEVAEFEDELSTPEPEAPGQLLNDWLLGSDHTWESESLPLIYTNRRRQNLYPLLQLRVGL